MNTVGRANLYRPDGSRRSDEEVLKEGGHVALRLAKLDDAMHRRVVQDDYEVHYPLRLFLSYKWAGEEHNAWVHQLAEKLRARGWDVVFDLAGRIADRSVEEFVSRLATCRLFVAVLTPEYLASAVHPKHPTWVFDEYGSALVNQDRMHLIGLWRSSDPEDAAQVGSEVREVSPLPPRIPAIVVQPDLEPVLDALYEVGDDEELDRLLDEALAYDGPRLEGQERERVVGELAAVRLLLDDPDAAVPILDAIVERHPFVYAAWRMLVTTLRDAGQLNEALDATNRALEAVHPMDDRLSFQRERIDLLNRVGRRQEAMRAATELIDARPRDWTAHFHLGAILDDVEDLWAARNHLLLSCSDRAAIPLAFNNLGVMYMGLGFLDRAEEVLEHALRLEPDLAMAKRNLDLITSAPDPQGIRDIRQVSGPLPGCSECEAIFYVSHERPLLCAACAAHLSPAGAMGVCPYCGHDGKAFVMPLGDGFMPVRCPVCRIGTITKKDYVLV